MSDTSQDLVNLPQLPRADVQFLVEAIDCRVRAEGLNNDVAGRGHNIAVLLTNAVQASPTPGHIQQLFQKPPDNANGDASEMTPVEPV